jgi:hypothetical protein
MKRTNNHEKELSGQVKVVKKNLDYGGEEV